MSNIETGITEELNAEQLVAVLNPIDVCTKIVAGAGTGKTKIISKRYVKLVQDLVKAGVENPLERILVITFTDKAANEMKTRILKTLEENNINCYGQENWISTIHAFCSKILKRHSIEIGLSPSFKLAKNKELEDIYQNIIQKIKYNEYKEIDHIEEIANDLDIDDEILKIENIIEFTEIKNIDIIFSNIFPIIHKIKSLGLTPKEFLMQSTKAIQDFSNTIENLSAGYETKEEYINEFHNLLSDYLYNDAVFDENLFEDFCTDKIIVKNGKRTPKEWGLSEKISDINDISEIELKLTKIIALIYGAYQQQLTDKDLIDFDDLINNSLTILKNNEIIKAYYQKHFKHIIVDEFQDTNLAQMKLMLTLLSPDAPNITIVGDKKQSIYGFRHAKMENIDNLHKSIEKLYQKKYPEIKLKTNYRSTPEILHTVNFVTENELGLNEKLQANPHKDFSEINSQVNLYKLININATNNINHSQGIFIAKRILEQKQEKQLYFKDFAILTNNHYEIDEIEKELQKYGIPTVKRVHTGYFQQDEICNISALLKIVQNPRNEYALIRILNINFSEKEIYEFKKALNKDKEQNNDFKNYNFADKILYYLEKDELKNLNAQENIIKYTEKLYETIEYINQNKKSMNLKAIFDKLVGNITPYNNYKNQKTIAENTIKIFRKIIFDYMKQETYTSVKKFNEYFEQIKNDKNFVLPTIETEDTDAVNLLTIHASKGLEYPYVFLTIKKRNNNPDKNNISLELNHTKGNFGIILNNFNNDKTIKSIVYKKIYDDINKQREALRLFYVGLTRAKQYLDILTFEEINARSKPAIYVNKLEEILEPQIIDVEEIALEEKPIYINEETETEDEIQNRTELENNNNNEILNPEIHLNFSKLNTFNHCEYKFLNCYVYKYPVLNSQNKGFATGSILHNLIYNSFVTSKFYTNQEILDFTKEIDLEETDIANICKTYDNFTKTKYAKLKSEEILNEYGFEFTYKNIKFNGDIDLIIKNSDDTVSVLDFKTNKNIEKDLPSYHKQLIIYKKALENKGLKIKELILLNIKPDEVKEFILSENEEKIAEEKLNDDIEKISNAYKNNFEEIINSESYTETKDACKYCEYKYVCQYTKNSP